MSIMKALTIYKNITSIAVIILWVCIHPSIYCQEAVPDIDVDMLSVQGNRGDLVSFSGSDAITNLRRDVESSPFGAAKIYGPAQSQAPQSGAQNINNTPVDVKPVVIPAVTVPVGGGLDLRPPYFNLAEGRKVQASATCGIDVPSPELYCKLIGATSTELGLRPHLNIIQGQICDYCEPHDHPPEYAVDGTERWWQSPPLSRGHQYNEVNFTIDLGQEFHVAYVFIKMANSPRPAVWVLDRSKDEGKTWEPWQYFADTDSNCRIYFGEDVKRQIEDDDDVICTTEYSNVVPLEGGEIAISLINHRPNAQNFSYASRLQEFTRATNVRLRLLRTKTLLGHLMALTRQDSTVTRRYFYSLKDISIGGRCVCNGHANTCDKTDPTDPNKLVCRCQHDTCGPQCDECCSGFRQKPWKPSTFDSINACEKCNCFDHSNDCDYDEKVDMESLSLDIYGKYNGGGVCKNCQHNTEGVNCHRCKATFYRKVGIQLNSTNMCSPCQCDLYYSTGSCAEESGICECKANFTGLNCQYCNKGYYDFPLCKQCECFSNGTLNEICQSTDGTCPCKHNFAGKWCDQCAPGYYNFPDCQRCVCVPNGALDYNCDSSTGQCLCKSNYGGLGCQQCSDGYYNYPLCQFCACDSSGTEEEICDKRTSRCLCKLGYVGERCETCEVGYYGFPECKKCKCNEIGAVSSNCDLSGQCQCKINFTSIKCDECAPGFHNFPQCQSCGCNTYGSQGTNCDQNGVCWCKSNFDGSKCMTCTEGFYNYPICEECNCDPAGVVYNFPGCGSMQDGLLCQCKPRVTGHICDICKPMFWNLQQSNPMGCEDCGCDPRGVVAGYKDCDPRSGQCKCKNNVGSRTCSVCKDGFYNLQTGNIFGCTSCQCNLGGSISNVCDKLTGQCPCLPRIEGRTCDRTIANHYVPMLNNMKYELENGRTPQGTGVRYAYDISVFPNYSWRGYAIFSALQPKIVIDVSHIPHGLYRLAARYVNKAHHQVLMDVSIKGRVSGDHHHSYNHQDISPFNLNPMAPSDFVVQKNQFTLFPIQSDKDDISQPRFAYAKTPESHHSSERKEFVGQDLVNDIEDRGLRASYFIDSNDVEVVFELQNPKDSVFLDYFVLIPAEYYEATKLQQNVDEICSLDENVSQSSQYCKQYAYPPITDNIYPGTKTTYGDQAYLLDRSSYWRNLADMVNNPTLVQKLNLSNDMVIIESAQDEIYFDFKLEPDDYVFTINYYTPGERSPDKLQTTVIDTKTKQETRAHVSLGDCRHKLLCRQVILNPEGKVLHYRVNNPQAYKAGIQPSRPGKQVVDDDGPIETGNVQIGFKMLVDQQFIQHTGSIRPRAAIASAVAIPTKYWNMDLVKPTLLFVNNGVKKMDTTYGQLAGAIKLNGKNLTLNQNTQLQSKTIDNETYMQLSQIGTKWTMEMEISKPGKYVFIIKYYQNLFPNFEAKYYIDSDHSHQIGTSNVDFCPNEKGCHGLLINDLDGSHIFELSQLANLTIKIAGNYTFWLNNIVLMPSHLYRDSWLQIQPVDQATQFIDKCEKTFFENDLTFKSSSVSSDNTFCNNALFSLSSDFNAGAQACECDTQGSISFSCDSLGGQCRCKANIIGRTCSRCRSGYYGFPNCRKCQCPLQLCDEVSGQCLCPPKVTGLKCDVCQPRTFGYDAIIGCEECSCNPAGVISSQDLHCDILTGQCNCRPHIGGRNCSICEVGYYGFPYCQSCNCDARGVSDDYCDQRNSACFCKENTEGPRCNRCKAGTFLIEAKNPKGCTSCFCFGVTQSCENSDLYWNDILKYEGWTIKNQTVSTSAASIIAHPEEMSIVAENLQKYSTSDGIYMSAPKEYLFDKIRSYGGIFSFELLLKSHGSYKDAIIHPTIILKGSNMTLVHYSDQQPSPNLPFHVSLQMNELAFEHMYDIPQIHHYHKRQLFKTVTREHLMLVLSSLEELLILVHYFPTNYETILRKPTLEMAMDADQPGIVKDDNRLALNVERCKCPSNYAGTSCESCASGFYRKTAGNSLGVCLPCQCSGHSNECEDESGICHNCQHNTFGDHCELCADGFYGDAKRGTSGDCQICPCPIPFPSNNFATSCYMESVGQHYTVVKCNCKANYIGMNCERCAPGYYGEPFKMGGSCNPCRCNNNLDMSQPEPCDSITGICLTCGHNTAGPSCNLCAAGHYGNALTGRCELCTCNMCGGECDNTNGKCRCHPNVVGSTCDKCALGFWDFDSCSGCQICNCSSASVSSQCDPITGQCECKPGVAGRFCEKCLNGFYNYGPNGCQTCQCAALGSIGTHCDETTGQCKCLPGVTGGKCDQCDERHVLMPGQGCQPCDKCIHTLLDDVEIRAKGLLDVSNEADEIAHGVFASKRLQQINGTITNLRPLMQNVISAGEKHSKDAKFTRNLLQNLNSEATKLVVDINPVSGAMLSLTVHSQFVQTKADNLAIGALESKDALENVTNIIRSTEDLLSDLHKSIYEAIIKTSNVENAIRINRIQGNTNTLLEEAQRMSNILSELSFKLNYDELKELHELAYEILYKAQFLEFAPKQLEESIVLLMKETLDSSAKMHEMINISTNALNASRFAATLLDQLQPSLIIQFVADADSEKFDLAEVLKDASKLLDETKSAYINASKTLQNIKTELVQTESVLNILEGEKLMTSGTIIAQDSILPLISLQSQALDHALGLEIRAQQLDILFGPTRRASDPAKRAATVYQTILELVSNSSWKAGSAEVNVQAAESSLGKEGISRSRQAFIDSREMLAKAREASNEIEFSTRDEIRELKTILERETDKMVETSRETEILEENLHYSNEGFNSATTTSTQSSLTFFEEISGGYGNQALKSIQKTLNTSENVNTALDTINGKLDLASQQLKNSPRSLTANGGAFMKTKIRETMEAVPKITNSASLIENRIKYIEQSERALTTEIDSLTQLIRQAKAQAEQISLGISTEGNSYVILKNPEHLTEATALTTLTGYFKTTRENGILFYAGMPSPFPKIQDFFGVIIEGGFIKLFFDLGSGPAVITSQKYVANNQWHRFKAERNGIQGKLSVVSAQRGEEEIQVGMAPGSLNVLNFDSKLTKIYVAGVPNDATLADIVPNPYFNFSGCIDGLVLNKQALGLWNFANASNQGLKACKERDVSFADETPTGNEMSTKKTEKHDLSSKDIFEAIERNRVNGNLNKLDTLNNLAYQSPTNTASNPFTFDGTGYVTVSKGKYNPMDKSHVGFRFKSLSPDGLLLYAKGNIDHAKDYLAIEMNNGLIIYHFNLGSGSTVLASSIRADDGKWHSIEAGRLGQAGLLKVDGKEVARSESLGIQTQLQIEESIFLGGVPDTIALSSGLTRSKFKGCLENIQLGTTYLELGKKPNPGVSLGCSNVNSALVSFPPLKKGYVSTPSVDIGFYVSVSMRFKTQSESSILIFSANADRSDVLALVLLNGNVVFISKNDVDTLSLSAHDKTFNDGQWHHLSAVKDESGLYLNIDDSYKYNLPGIKQEIRPTSPVFLGGIPATFADITEDFTGGTDSSLYFAGCLSDVSINNNVIDFTRMAPEYRPGVIIGECQDAVINESHSLTPLENIQTGRRPFENRSQRIKSMPNTSTFSTKFMTTPFEVDIFSSPESTFTTSIPFGFLKTNVSDQFDGSCVLPLKPAELSSTSIESDTGISFYKPDSWLEYDKLPARHRVRHDFSISIKTKEPTGLIFYVADVNHGDYIYLALVDGGRLVYAFSTGRQPCLIRSPAPDKTQPGGGGKHYNDDVWHRIIFKREARRGELIVDGEVIGSDKAQEASRTLNVNAPYYVGGLPKDVAKKAMSIIGKNVKSFKGCLREFKLNSMPLGKPSKKIGVSKCPALAESGTFFPGNNSFIELDLEVQSDLIIKIELKPRVMNGIILTVMEENESYMNLQLLKGDIVFDYDTGAGPTLTTYPLSKDGIFICDGHWHSIEIIKTRNIITMSLDGVFVNPTIGADVKEPLKDTYGRVFVGAVPDFVVNKGIKTRNSFVGCIRQITFNGKIQSLSNKKAVGDITLLSCPFT